MPMGIRRVEHKEEGVTMTTAAEIEAQENAGFVEDDSDEDGLFVSKSVQVEAIEEQPAGNETEAAETRSIKQEEVDDSGAMDLDDIPVNIKAPPSPEQKKKVPTGEQKPKKKVAAPKDPEADIIAEDLQHMLNLFTVQDDGAAEGGATTTTTNAALEGHMFLFQFPPILPPLHVVPRDGTAANPATVKPDPDEDVVMQNQPAASIDLTQGDDNNDKRSKVKQEADGDAAAEEAKKKADNSGRGEITEGGYLGNLIVRKSGRVELDWGGQRLEMMPGIQANFLSTAVLVERNDVKPTDPSQMAGVAYGMGKIQGSFTLAPVWGEEEEWVVDPKDLEIPEEA